MHSVLTIVQDFYVHSVNLVLVCPMVALDVSLDPRRDINLFPF